MTEEIFVSLDELGILRKCRRKLEFHFGVKMRMPEVLKHSSNDIFVVSMSGMSQNINCAKEYLKKEVNELAKKRQCSAVEDNCIVITLSDSESEITPCLETQNQKKRKRKRSQKNRYYSNFELNEKKQASHISKPEFTDSSPSSSANCYTTETTKDSPSISQRKDSIVIISSSAGKDTTDVPNDSPSISEHNDSIVIISESINPQLIEHVPLVGVGNDPTEQNKQLISSIGFQQVPNVFAPLNSKVTECLPKESTTKDADDSVIILSDNVCLPPAADFIPFRTGSKCQGKNKILSVGNSMCTSVLGMISDHVTIPRPTLNRILRPIVIDGSNVARAHGQIPKTFSCKGIKLSVEFFLKRGHTQVTAFVPNFRRHCNHTHIPTTDQQILEDLAKTQNVVFTPSRRLDGKMISCYDDRFIVDLASKNNGVILSNDNFRDIMEENPVYKNTIQERLLMYCFVGDLLMIPDDPLGRNGPKLDTFLSMEQSVGENQSNSQKSNQMFVDEIQRITNVSTSNGCLTVTKFFNV